MQLFDAVTENQGRELALPPPSATARVAQRDPELLNISTTDDQAVPISITVARTLRIGNVENVPVVQPADPQFANAVVVVQWGAAGGVARAEVDVGLGTTFCVTASSVKVWALGTTGIEDESPTILRTQPNEAKTVLRAWAAFGTSPCEPPTRSVKLASTADGGAAIAAGAESALVRMPAFARRAYACIAPASAAGIEVRFYRLFNAELVGAALTTAADIIPPASATYVSVFNGSLNPLTEARVRFELAW